jgi:hypothetical protein
MAAMRIALVAVAVLGCKREAAPKPTPAPASTPAPSTALAAADAQIVDSVAGDADRDAGSVELVLTADGVRPFEPNMRFDQTVVAAAVPGYTVKVDEREYEGTPDNRLIVSRGGTELVELGESRAHTIGVVGVLSHEIRSEIGYGVGSTYEQVVAAAGAMTCEKPPHDDPYSDNVVCSPTERGAFQLVFTPVKQPKPPKQDEESDGFDIPASQIPQVLKGAALDVLFVRL